MKKFYATITKKDGTQFTVGEYSHSKLHQTLNKIHFSKQADLNECRVEIEVVEIPVFEDECKKEEHLPPFRNIREHLRVLENLHRCSLEWWEFYDKAMTYLYYTAHFDGDDCREIMEYVENTFPQEFNPFY